MTRILSCYYLDDPLSDDERRLVEHSLLGPWAKFPTGAAVLLEKRVPAVLPLPDANGHFCTTLEERVGLIRSHLRHAGIIEDAGKQVLWVMPEDREWDAIFQCALRDATGFGPYVVQRWFDRGTLRERGHARIVNTQMLIDGLEQD